MCARRVIYKPSTPEERKLVGLLHNMVVRCHCKTSPRYYDYGGRGISVCSEWYDSENGKYHNGAFVKWALANGYQEGLQIDRIDNSGNYSPDNCRFITAHSNSRNRRNTIHVNVNGVDMCGKDACKFYKTDYADFTTRIKLGWDPKRAAMIPHGFRRRDLCFHKTRTGYCYHPFCAKNRKSKCPHMTDEQMKGCPYFYEYKPEDRDYVVGTLGREDGCC